MDSSSAFGLTTPDKRLEWKFDQFSAFCNELQRKLGDTVTLSQVIDAEVGKVLEKTISATGAADESKIEKKWEEKRAVRMPDGTQQGLYNRKTGRAEHFTDARWELIKQAKARGLARDLAKVGVSKQSWYLLGQKAGLNIKAPNYVKAAKLPFFNVANDVDVNRQKQNGIYGIEITNSMPILRWNPPGGLAALFKGIAGRIGFFRDNLAKGVFNDVDAIAKKYPGIQTQIANNAVESALTYDE